MVFDNLHNWIYYNIPIKIIKLELKFDYMKLGKFISKKYDKEDVIDYSYQEKFFLLNHDNASYLLETK